MEFMVNYDLWNIKMVSKNTLITLYKEEQDSDEEVYFVFGMTNKAQHTIFLNEDMVEAQQIKTLKHELTHCYIWEFGLYNVPNFDEEMVCDLVASINDWINEIVKNFKLWKEEGEIKCI